MIVLDQELLDQVLRNIREAARKETEEQRDCYPVWLHVYDLSHTARYVLNNWWSKMSGLGAFHCGIEVLGAEWAFQAPSGQSDVESDDRTGLMCHHAKVHPVHVYRESVYLGESPLGVSDIWNLLLQLERRWLASTYHVVNRNCTDFAVEFAKALCVREDIPAWVHGIAKGWLRQTPLANVDSSFLPRSCGSSVSMSQSESVRLRGIGSSVATSNDAGAGSAFLLSSLKQDLSDIDRRLPVEPAGPTIIAPPMQRRLATSSCDHGANKGERSLHHDPHGRAAKGQVFIIPPLPVTPASGSPSDGVKLLKTGGPSFQDSGRGYRSIGER